MQVQLPDGTLLEFPDGMSEADMAAAIQKNFPQFAPKQPEQPTGLLKSVIDGAMPATGLDPSLGKWIGEKLQSNVVKPATDYANRKPLTDPKTNQPYPEMSSRLPTEAVPGAVDFLTGILKPESRKLTDKPRGMDMLTEGLTGALVPDEKHRAEIYKNARKVTIDGVDTYIVNKDGKDYVINQPGPSPQDLVDVAAPAVATSLAAAGPAALATSTLGRAAATGTGLGAYSLAEDALSRGLGSTQEISPKKAAINAVLGFGTQIAADKIGKVIRGVSDKPDALTSAARARLEKAGVDPATISPEMFQALNKNLPFAKNADDAIRMARFDAFKVTPTQGQIGRNPKTMRAERAAQSNAFDGDSIPQARKVQDILSTTQPEQIRTAARNLAGADTVGIGKTQNALSDAYSKSKLATKSAYDNASSLGAMVKPESTNDLIKASKQIAAEFDRPTIGKLADDFSKLVSPKGDAKVTGVSLDAMEMLRKRASALSRSSDTVEAGAAKRFIAEFDKLANKLVATDFTRGGPQAFETFKKARALRVDQSIKFEGDNLIPQLLERTRGLDQAGKPTWQLRYTPQEAADILVGNLSKKESAAALSKARMVLGPQSEAWKELKSEVVSRIVGTKSIASDANASAAHVRSSIRSIETNNPGLKDILFTKQEWAKLRQFADLLDDVKPQSGTINPSGTSFMADFLAGNKNMPRPIRNFLGDRRTIGQLNQSLNPKVQMTQPAPLGVAPGLTVPSVNDKRYQGPISPYRGLLNLFE